MGSEVTTALKFNALVIYDKTLLPVVFENINILNINLNTDKITVLQYRAWSQHTDINNFPYLLYLL